MSDVSDKARRICEVAVCILDGVPTRRLNTVVLNKALFYADLIALRDYGETLTGSRYLALPAGPTIEGYERHLVRGLTRLGWAKQLTEGLAKPVQKLAMPDVFLFLSAERRDLAWRLGERFAPVTSAMASDFSHANPGWMVARRASAEQNNRGMPINMVLAMQQLDPDDDADWLSKPFTEEELAALRSAKPGVSS